MENNAILGSEARVGHLCRVLPVLPYEALKGLIARSHPATAEHSVRVRICATEIGRKLNLSGFDLSVLSIAAELHDIGKIYLPQAVLDSTAKLSESEWQLVWQHPIWGAMATEQSFVSMPEIAQCIMMHHERMDGSGYPYGLSGDQIPYLARVIALADAFAALTEDRPYRSAYSSSKAVHVLYAEEAGRYDEQLLSALAGCS